MKVKDFAGKTVFITGGSSGIGLACAEMLAARGANVLIIARRPDLLETAVKQIESKRVSEKQRFSAVQLDVSDRDRVVDSLSRAVKEFAPPDILINSAGVSFPQKFEDIPFEKYRRDNEGEPLRDLEYYLKPVTLLKTKPRLYCQCFLGGRVYRCLRYDSLQRL